jgi:hypothetical protein
VLIHDKARLWDALTRDGSVDMPEGAGSTRKYPPVCQGAVSTRRHLRPRVVIGGWRELILSIDGERRRMRVFKRDGPPLHAAIAETVTKLAGKGWRSRVAQR